MKALKEQLRQKEEQLQANQQQSSLLAAELRDASSTRDRTMSELYHMKLEADSLRQAKAEAQAQCVRLERLVEQMKAEAKQEAVRMIISLLTVISLALHIELIMGQGWYNGRHEEGDVPGSNCTNKEKVFEK